MSAQGKAASKVGNIVTGIFVFVFIILVLLVSLPLILLAVGLSLVHRALCYFLIWLLWLPRGRDILFVHSESPIWMEYMTGEVLPLVQDRAVVLNWSDRKRWSQWSIAVQAFHAFGGEREFNPMVIVFRPFRLAQKFRFWPAFKAWKHGDKEPVTKLRQELSLVL